MKIDIMKKGEAFLGMQDGRIFLQTRKGEVRIVSVVMDEDGIRIDEGREIIIGFGDGTVTVGDAEDGIEVTTF